MMSGPLKAWGTTMSDALQAAYVLHARDYRDTSQILELFSRSEGRFSVVARGSRGARSKLKGRLQPFTPLLVGCVGRGEMKTATTIDFPKPACLPFGDQLLLGLYVNELLYRLLGRYDPMPRVYDGYEMLLGQLQVEEISIQAVRYFELLLLQELGYGINFDYDAGNGTAINADSVYRYVVHEGFYVTNQTGEDFYPGTELIAISSGDLVQVAERRLKKITRQSLAELLGEKPLKSRAMFQGGNR
jgi:DNA repair protein RecO (recombination protein O)